MKNKTKGYIFLFITLLINIVTVIQSTFPAQRSSEESGFVTRFFIRLGNVFSNVQEDVIAPTSLHIDEQSPLVQGESRRLNVAFTPENTTNKSLIWESSREDVVKVTSGGIVVAEGDLNIPVTITAKSAVDHSIKTSVDVVIKENPMPTDFDLIPSKAVQKVGLTVRLLVTNVEPRFADINKITFSTNKPYASVDENGIVRANEAGVVEVNAKAGDLIKTVSLDFIEDNEEIIAPISLNIQGSNEGSIYTYIPLEASFGDVIPTDSGITWTSSDPNIAAITFKDDSDRTPLAFDGLKTFVYGQKFAGTATITATSNYDSSVYSEFLITFSPLLPEAISLNLDHSIYSMGKSYPLTVNFTPSNTTVKEVYFESSSEDIAVVENFGDYGRFVGLKPGEVTINAVAVANNEVVASKKITITYLSEGRVDDIHAFIRKAIGHFLLYFVNGIFAMLTIYYLFNFNMKVYAFISGTTFGLLMSGLTEFIQYFIPGRAGLFSDVAINFLGFMSAVGLFFLVHFIYEKHLKNKTTKQSSAGSTLEKEE